MSDTSPHPPSPETFHEGKVCDAIIRYLEKREDSQRRDVVSREGDHNNDAVELTFTLGSTLFAIEHTGIEPFSGHVRLNREAQYHYDPIRAALNDILPPGIFELHVPILAMQGRNRVEAQRIQRAIAAWVLQVSTSLPLKPYAEYRGEKAIATLQEVGFEIALHRYDFPGWSASRFQIKHFVPPDSGESRRERMKQACERKFPKLHRWKENSGAHTILVLEDNDIQLTNHVIVAETYLPIARAMNNRPDETYLVSTVVDTWNAWPLLIDNTSLLDMFDHDQNPRWEIDPSTLRDLTA